MFEKERDCYLKQHRMDRMNLKAVLFDMDGVLFDSMKNHAEAWHRAMAQYGFNLPREEAYMHEGRTGAGTINIVSQRQRGHNATEKEIQEIYATKSDIFNTLPIAQPMPGAWSLLQQLKTSGITPILVTGSGQHSLLDRLNRHFPDTFHRDLMVTAFDVRIGKPNPEPYLMALKKGNLQPHEAIVVENAPLGVRAGVAAGLFTVAVNTGPLQDHFLLDEGANLLLHSMQELSDRWEELYCTMRQA